ncbi:MAG: HlyD family secretion protein [Deltaproteobacteria bacterium]|nr:HlyD family secretion protein [Deltaproteobacteria bacterium]
MIAFLTLCYCAIIWVIFFKLKLLPWNRGSQGAVVGIGIAAILALLISMNLFQPYSKDVRVYQKVIQIVPRVTGRVVEVPLQANAAVKQGDVLFRIDPEPFQYEVDRITADLRLKKIVLDDAKGLVGAQAAAEIKLDRAQAAYDQTRAQLGNANVNLRETTVYAPGNGVVTNLALRPGQIASQMASMPVMTFIETDKPIVIATFEQSALDFVAVGDAAEIAFDRLPGRILNAHLQAIIPATGQGQLPPSGQLMEWTQTPVPGRFAVRLQIDDDSSDLQLPAGTAGVAAIYTDRGKAIRIVRKVVIRMTTWLNYVIL